MPRPKSTPKYALHKASGQAVVRIDGKHTYLGKHGTPESHAQYVRVINEWRVRQEDAAERAKQEAARDTAVGSTLDVPAVMSVAEMLLAYLRFAKIYNVKNGEPTSELDGMKAVIKLVDELYGPTSAAAFGPLALEAVRQHMIDSNLCRTEINKRIGRIKRIFKWAVSEELVPPSVHQGLTTVVGLRRGRTEAREAPPVKPVDQKDVDAVLPLVSPLVADMIRLQALTGMRPGEVVQMRPADIDRSQAIWIYRPAEHKTQHHGHRREIPLGSKAQRVLRTYLDCAPDASCFSPAKAEAARNAELYGRINKWRKTPVFPCEMLSRERRKAEREAKRFERRRPPKNRYTRDSYRRAITYAIKRAQRKDPNVKHWHPYQLRHLCATEIRRAFGIEAAQVVLGHARADVTEVYAERDSQRAIEVAAAVG